MNYKEFVTYREEIIKNPKILDLGNTNLYDFFKDLSIKDKISEINNVYRCHLVEDYLRLFNINNSFKKNIGVSSGVRDSLKLLFNELSDWEIPQDVYPFYQETLNKQHSSYITLKNDSIFSNIKDTTKTLLITYPMKPNSIDLSIEDKISIFNFLDKDKDNIIVIDAVYAIDGFNYFLWDLYNTNQVIILHSLSKMMLLPNYFGVSFLPNTNLGQLLYEKFKQLPKNTEKLKTVHFALNSNNNINQQLINFFKEQELKVRAIIPNLKMNDTYLAYSEKSPAYYLDKNILVIPESVFGGINNGSIISSLFDLNIEK